MNDTIQTQSAMPGEDGGIAKRLVLGVRRRIELVKSHWLLGLVYGVAVAVGALMVNDLYDTLKPWGNGTDAFLQQMKQDQTKAFASLEEGLQRIRGSIDGGDRAAFRQVSEAVEELKDVNVGLMSQLALAKQENERLSQVAARQHGVSGGYDFILGENTGLRLDRSTQIGVDTISGDGAYVRLSAKDTQNARTFLDNGESVAYTNGAGQPCKVTLLSVSGGSAASFALSCPATGA